MHRARARVALAPVLGAAMVGAFAACVPTKPPAPPAFDRMVDADGQAAPGNCDATDTAHATIAEAITAAAVDDVVGVCPGTYIEQLTIPDTKDGIALVATQSRATIIKAPASMAEPGDIIRVDGASDVTIAGFVIAGPLPNALFCSTETRTGIFVAGGGSATIEDNQITQVRATDASLRGCQNGIAIRVGRQAAPAHTGTATITNNDFDTYQKGAIVVDNTGSSATITGNAVTGDGSVDHIAQNGIQVSRGATATVEQNQVSGHEYTGTAVASSTGILAYIPGKMYVITNGVSANDDNIAGFNVDGSTFQNNVLTNSTSFDGIFLDGDSTGNTLLGNFAQDNELFDCEDDSTDSGTAGTGNNWVLNIGATSDPEGLCTGLEPTMTALSEAPARAEPSPAP